MQEGNFIQVIIIVAKHTMIHKLGIIIDDLVTFGLTRDSTIT